MTTRLFEYGISSDTELLKPNTFMTIFHAYLLTYEYLILSFPFLIFD